MSGQQAVLQVVILRDGLLVGTEVFTPGTYALGSDPSADLRLDDVTITRRHAVLYFQNGRAAIQDAGSGSGVYVNGHRISACEIRSTDEVLCGPFVLKTRVLSQQPRDTRPQPPPEVAALLGASPPPAAPLPPRAAAPVPPVPSPQQLAATQPIARPSGSMRPASAVPPPPPPATVPLARASVAPTIPGDTAVYGESPTDVSPPPRAAASPGPGASAAPVRAVPPSEPPAPPVSTGTLPSARRRTPQPVRPPAPSLVLADELLADLPPDLRPTQAPATEQPWRNAPLARPTHAPRLDPARGPAHLYLELYWGAVRREARRFAPGRKPVKAAADEQAPMPLWGFNLPAEPFTLAESVNGAFRLYVPKGTQVERSGQDGRFTPVAANALEAEGERRYLTLRAGTAARLTQGEMSLVACAAPLPEKVRVNPLKGLPWLALGSFFFLASALGGFIAVMPKTPEGADFTQKNLPPVALRLIAPQPKKKEEARKKLEAIKKANPKQVANKDTQKPVTPEPPTPKPQRQRKPQPKEEAVAAAPESNALKALSKLSAAGPATKDMLAAVDKLGSGPGSKNAKNSNFKLSGLIGKAPIANAGLGTFGLGGGGKGGGATLGAEILRGKGGGGIGALGAGGVGKGKVGGTVTRATARTIAAQGSIDRDAVAKVVNSHLQEVYACYERALLKDPGLAGKVVLEWTIGTNGRVVATKTKSSTLRSPSVEACILGGLKTWTFPPAKGGAVIITYPFIFNSVGY